MKPLTNAILNRLTSWLAGEEEFVFLESGRVDKENHQSLLFCRPHGRLLCMPGDSAARFLAMADRLRKQGFFLAGWLSYEFAYLLEPALSRFSTGKDSDPNRPLAVLGIYDDPYVFDHATGLFKEGREWPMADAKDEPFSCNGLAATLTREEYLQAVRAIQEYIRAGDTYQVNFTLHLDFLFQGSFASLYRNLRCNQSVSYGAWLRFEGRDIMSFSPELFFHADTDRVRVRPMKGTMARGRTPAEDEVQKQNLHSDPKNRSENVMIVDLLRNDLGRLLHVAGGGRVVPRSLFDVEIYESLLQMTSTIEGIPESRGAIPLTRLLSALFPCGSVTGAPKIRTMEIIHELEKRARGVYCGAIGYSGPEVSCFNVPIRTLELEKGQGRMGIGSGIVADSDPDGEWRECLLKGRFLTRSEPEFQLIETLLWEQDSGFFLMEYHMERLAASARYFLFFMDRELVQAGLQEAVAGSRGRLRVRLLLYRDGRVAVTKTGLPEKGLPSEQLRVCFSTQQVDSDNPYLFHKTTSRSLFDHEYEQAVSAGYFEVLFTNLQGQVTEGAITNLFVKRKGVLLTPPVECGLLAGTFRRKLLAEGRAVEQVLTVDDVLAAEEVYVANSVRGLVRVRVEQERLNGLYRTRGKGSLGNQVLKSP